MALIDIEVRNKINKGIAVELDSIVDSAKSGSITIAQLRKELVKGPLSGSGNLFEKSTGQNVSVLKKISVELKKVLRTREQLTKSAAVLRRSQNFISDAANIAQDAPYGFRAISKNIPQVIRSFQLLQTEAGGTRQALQSLARTVFKRFTPTAIIGTVAAAAVAIASYRNEIELTRDGTVSLGDLASSTWARTKNAITAASSAVGEFLVGTEKKRGVLDTLFTNIPSVLSGALSGSSVGGGTFSRFGLSRRSQQDDFTKTRQYIEEQEKLRSRVVGTSEKDSLKLELIDLIESENITIAEGNELLRRRAIALKNLKKEGATGKRLREFDNADNKKLLDKIRLEKSEADKIRDDRREAAKEEARKASARQRLKEVRNRLSDLQGDQNLPEDRQGQSSFIRSLEGSGASESELTALFAKRTALEAERELKQHIKDLDSSKQESVDATNQETLALQAKVNLLREEQSLSSNDASRIANAQATGGPGAEDAVRQNISAGENVESQLLRNKIQLLTQINQVRNQGKITSEQASALIQSNGNTEIAGLQLIIEKLKEKISLEQNQGAANGQRAITNQLVSDNQRYANSIGQNFNNVRLSGIRSATSVQESYANGFQNAAASAASFTAQAQQGFLELGESLASSLGGGGGSGGGGGFGGAIGQFLFGALIGGLQQRGRDFNSRISSGYAGSIGSRGPNTRGGFGGFGFMDGGYTGPGSRSRVNGFVHAREFVMPANVTAKHRPAFEAIRRTGEFPSGKKQQSVIINNNSGVPIGVESMTPGQITLIADRVSKRNIRSEAPRQFARDMGRPNSQIRRSVVGNTTARHSR